MSEAKKDTNFNCHLSSRHICVCLEVPEERGDHPLPFFLIVRLASRSPKHGVQLPARAYTLKACLSIRIGCGVSPAGTFHSSSRLPSVGRSEGV